jgi:hypothetical protein
MKAAAPISFAGSQLAEPFMYAHSSTAKRKHTAGPDFAGRDPALGGTV